MRSMEQRTPPPMPDTATITLCLNRDTGAVEVFYEPRFVR